MHDITPQQSNVETILASRSPDGMFRDKTWRISPEPFRISPRTFESIQRLGPVLHRFQRACNLIYRRSVLGTLPTWVADYLDRGKPKPLVDFGRQRSLYDTVPLVIRPDLVLTKHGLAITELDTVPGGIGLTSWLNQLYSGLGFDVIGGKSAMLDGFASMFPKGADLVISQESDDYRPEMEWLVEQLPKNDWSLHQAESYEARDKAIYRFFELFDLKNVPFASKIVETSKMDAPITAPMKAFLEEKLWLALFWSRPLQDVWRRELRASNWKWLQLHIPYGWVVDPTPIPHHAVIPGLGINDFSELTGFSQRERNLVLKISGFSDQAWGSRGVHMGMDLSQLDWGDAMRHAIDSFPHHPYVLQEFHKGRVVEHPFWNEETQSMETLKGRVRLCPYYFVPGTEDGKAAGKPALSGILATICPEDKKILHGMKDAIIVPCMVDDNGW